MHVRRASHGSARPLNCGVRRHSRTALDFALAKGGVTVAISDWIVILLAAIGLLMLVFGVLIVLRLGSIDESTHRAAHILEHDVLRLLSRLTSNELGSTGHDVATIRETLREVPSKLDRIVAAASGFRPKREHELETDGGQLKYVGVGEAVLDIAKDVSAIRAEVQRK
jgi:hypothetical protein